MHSCMTMGKSRNHRGRICWALLILVKESELAASWRIAVLAREFDPLEQQGNTHRHRAFDRTQPQSLDCDGKAHTLVWVPCRKAAERR